uniref:Col_cuticle_N domain-containing protein n=1 Tax=Steinernema glaseri TaxID=37863 RepID=A0A1I7ZFW3_9BILA
MVKYGPAMQRPYWYSRKRDIKVQKFISARHRNAIRRRKLIYEEQCETILKSSPWRFGGANSLLDNVGFGCVLGTLLCLVLTLVNNQREKTNAALTAISMLLAGILLSTALLATAANIYLIRIELPKRRIDALVKQLQSTTPCWSFAVGIIGLVLCFTCAYLNMAKQKKRRVRQRSQMRRRQLQTAIMSSCKQEIALAIRAKMTVI